MPRTYKSLPRLFVESDLAGESREIALTREHSTYLVAVLRMQAGDEAVLFNGRDGAWRIRITAPNKKGAVVQVVEQIAAQTTRSDLWFGFAPLKTARLDYVVQKATEMGAGVIQPVITRFTQVNRIRTDKILANAIEAAEQCEVLSVPSVGPEVTLESLLDNWPSEHGRRRLIFADEGEASSSPVTSISALSGEPVGLLVGPEGGFSEEERARLRALSYVVPVSLGPRILRADTAAVAALALIQATIGDWR
jgi:16S rRNA (uracil1498-N3)-methyltransferase